MVDELSNLLILLRAAQAGDDSPTALHRLQAVLRESVRRHLPASSPLRADLESEDLIQEVMLQLITRIDRFRGSTWPEFLAFVETLSLRCATDHLRRARIRRVDVRDPMPAVAAHPCSDPTPGTMAATKDDQLHLQELLASLPEPYRSTLRLRMAGERSTEIAARLGVSHATVRQRIARATRMLQERW